MSGTNYLYGPLPDYGNAASGAGNPLLDSPITVDSQFTSTPAIVVTPGGAASGSPDYEPGGSYSGTGNSTLLPGGVDDYGNPTDPTNPMFPTTSGTAGAAGSAITGIPGAVLQSLTGSSGQGWLQLVEELAIRVMLGLLGMVLSRRRRFNRTHLGSYHAHEFTIENFAGGRCAGRPGIVGRAGAASALCARRYAESADSVHRQLA
jgi:hypothetical protein